MYLKNIIIENTGPIKFVESILPFHENGNPKPLVVIGQNGAGKSIFISQIVNTLITAKQLVYEDYEVERGKVFKYRNPAYINIGTSFSYSKVTFEQDLFQSEWQLDRSKSDYEDYYKHTPLISEWAKIESKATSHLNISFMDQVAKVKDLIDNNCILYFPANRFEEPGWLNYDNLINKADYRFLKRVSNYSNRKVINYSPLKDNQNWLLDLLFDRNVLELKTNLVTLPVQQPNGEQVSVPVNLFQGYEGESNNLLVEIINFLAKLFQTNETIRFGIGKRRGRQVEIIKGETAWITNLFNLSTGETLLLNIFLTIIKDFDLSVAQFQSLKEVRGIVVIDEVDIHLHSNLQYIVLPQLIKMFPKVQFIMTSHSPLFLLGLRNELGDANFEIINLPDGQNINVESFSEFETAYKYYKDSIKFQTDVKNEIAASQKDFLFVEGDYDIRYLSKAAELLDQTDLINNFKMVDSEGHGNITVVAKHFDSKLAEVTPQKIVLLYDCDQQKQEGNKGHVYKRVMPTFQNNPILKGIENMFSQETLNKAKAEKTAFIDITPEITKLVRGKEVIIPEAWEVNKNEKKNLCDWIIENGTKEDFANFSSIFEILMKIQT